MLSLGVGYLQGSLGPSVPLSSEHEVGESVSGEGVSSSGRPEKETVWAVLGKLTQQLSSKAQQGSQQVPEIP